MSGRPAFRETSAMGLHRDLADPQVVGDLLVEEALCHAHYAFAFPPLGVSESRCNRA